MNEKKTPANRVWADGDGDRLWARAPHKVPPTRSAAYVRTSVPGVFLTADQCREAAAHLTALADYHEEAARQSAQALPAEPGTVIVPADGHEYITATVGGVTYRAREAILIGENQWHAAWRSDEGVLIYVTPERINPGTWKKGNR